MTQVLVVVFKTFGNAQVRGTTGTIGNTGATSTTGATGGTATASEPIGANGFDLP